MIFNRKAWIEKHHNPNAVAESELGHVVSIWEDGEITSEKGGSLFGQRTCHMMQPGVADLAWPVHLFPVQNSHGHGRIWLHKGADASALVEEMLGFRARDALKLALEALECSKAIADHYQQARDRHKAATEAVRRVITDS